MTAYNSRSVLKYDKIVPIFIKNPCICKKFVYNTTHWKLGRAVECTGLENRRGFIAHREFESLSFRHIFLLTHRLRKLGRAVECTGLENRRGFIAHREFESLSFRHYSNRLIL